MKSIIIIANIIVFSIGILHLGSMEKDVFYSMFPLLLLTTLNLYYLTESEAGKTRGFLKKDLSHLKTIVIIGNILAAGMAIVGIVVGLMANEPSAALAIAGMMIFAILTAYYLFKNKTGYTDQIFKKYFFKKWKLLKILIISCILALITLNYFMPDVYERGWKNFKINFHLY